jgi:hypothetical protein
MYHSEHSLCSFRVIEATVSQYVLKLGSRTPLLRLNCARQSLVPCHTIIAVGVATEQRRVHWQLDNTAEGHTDFPTVRLSFTGPVSSSSSFFNIIALYGI